MGFAEAADLEPQTPPRKKSFLGPFLLVFTVVIAGALGLGGFKAIQSARAAASNGGIIIEKNGAAVTNTGEGVGKVVSLEALPPAPNPAADAAVLAIKSKGAEALSTVGIADVQHSGDTLCLYVDQRFSSLSGEQQRRLLELLAGEWGKALGKNAAAVRVLDSASQKLLSESVI